MPTVQIPHDETEQILTGCGGTRYSFQIKADNNAALSVRIAATPGGVVEGEEIQAGRPVTLEIPDGVNQVYAKAYGTSSPVTVVVNEEERGISVRRDAPDVIDAIREPLEISGGGGGNVKKLRSFEVSGNYSHQYDPGWSAITRIEITRVDDGSGGSDSVDLEVTALDGDSDQFPVYGAGAVEGLLIDGFKLHDPDGSTPHVAGYFIGYD